MERTFVESLVSVITPIYNSEKFIGKTIDSVISQTYKNFEIITVDDCSTDSSSQIIKAYQEKYSNIVYYKQPQNLGAAKARNKALELAKGQYVAFLDSDDLWKPEKLEKQINLMKSQNVSFCFSAIEMINDKEEIVKPKRNVKETIDYDFLLRNTMIPTSSVVIDRNKFGDFKMPLMRGGQDYATWLMLLRNGTKAYGINEALVQYRTGHSSLSSNKFKSIKQVWNIQTKQEKISKRQTAVNVCWFVVNAVKKYFL